MKLVPERNIQARNAAAVIHLFLHSLLLVWVHLRPESTAKHGDIGIWEMERLILKERNVGIWFAELAEGRVNSVKDSLRWLSDWRTLLFVIARN